MRRSGRHCASTPPVATGPELGTCYWSEAELEARERSGMSNTTTSKPSGGIDAYRRRDDPGGFPSVDRAGNYVVSLAQCASRQQPFVDRSGRHVATLHLNVATCLSHYGMSVLLTNLKHLRISAVCMGLERDRIY